MAQIARKPTYSDLDLDFIAHPTTGDVMKKTGEDAIKRSVRNLILTNFYDRPFRSFIGSNVNKILFDNITVFTQKFLEDAVRDVLNNYEPRISISNIEVEVDNENNGFYVTLTFNIINMLEPLTTIIFLERIR
jgi:phage baseplate assembly protein W